MHFAPAELDLSNKDDYREKKMSSPSLYFQGQTFKIIVYGFLSVLDHCYKCILSKEAKLPTCTEFLPSPTICT